MFYGDQIQDMSFINEATSTTRLKTTSRNISPSTWLDTGTSGKRNVTSGNCVLFQPSVLHDSFFLLFRFNLGIEYRVEYYHNSLWFPTNHRQNSFQRKILKNTVLYILK